MKARDLFFNAPQFSKTKQNYSCSKIFHVDEHGHPDRAFFKNFKLLGLGRHFGLNFFEALRLFSARLSAPILVL